LYRRYRNGSPAGPWPPRVDLAVADLVPYEFDRWGSPSWFDRSLALRHLRANERAGIVLPQRLTVDSDDKPAFRKMARRDRRLSRGRRSARRQDQAVDASMKRFMQHQEQPVDVSTEPIGRELKTCILTELFAHPGSRVVKRGGHLFSVKGRFEILCERLCKAKRHWR